LLSIHSKLELERTINSMSLAAEREILKQIHKLKIQRRQVAEFLAHDREIKEKKTTVTTLRESLKEQRTEISELKTELTTVNTAVELGCEVKDLLGKKIDCPVEKLGNVIGKKGKNLARLKTSTHVNVDIVRNQGDIRLIGTLDSLDAAVSNLDKVIQQTEETLELPPGMHTYLTSAKITALSQLRERHSDVYFNISRSNGDEAATNQVRVRGSAADIQAFKSDVHGMHLLVTTELQLTAREAGLLVGKAGATIAALVQSHQAAIEVKRPPKKDEAADPEETTKVTISGPSDNVAAATAEIEAMVEANKDREAFVSVDPHVKAALLLNNGAGIQTLHKKANAATKKALGGVDATNSGASYVAVNFSNGGIAVKGKVKALESAMVVVTEEVSRIESMLITITVDPFVIPAMIGKGGQGVKDLKEGTKTVYLDLDREAGKIVVCGLEKDEIDKVIQAIEAAKADHHVQRLRLDCDDDSGTNSFSAQFRNFLRSAAMKDVKELVFMVADDAAKQLVLRGKPENVTKAASLVNEFLVLNFMEELIVSAEDLTALLTGGKKSKIVELAASTGVNLSTDRDRNALIAKGEKDKVVSAMKAVREFLYGSDDVAVSKIALASGELMGVVIGKGGKTKADLQEKFPSVSIIMHRTDAAITLRGQRQQVEQCHVEIMKLILSASIARTTDLSEKQLTDMNKTKFNRRIGQLVPVQVILSKEKSNITFRGSAADVQVALSLLKEHLEGVYESRMQLGTALFKKVKDACRNPVHLDRIEKQSHAKVSLDDKTEDIVFSGKRETVKQAKNALLTFFDFLFGPNMCRCNVPGPLFSMVGKPASLAEVAAMTGTQVIVDRDLSSILIFSSEADKGKEASTMINSKVAEVEKLVYVLQLDASEDWLVSNIIGKSGDSVKKLRKQSGCNIEVESKDRRVIVSANDAELVTKGKEILDKLVETSRRECVFIAISQQDLPAFVGRSGANIREFSKKHGVEVQIMKNQGGAVRITGDEDKVAAAKSGVEEWLAGRAEAHKDAEGELTKRLKADQIPAVIGAKGATIRSLEREFECKIDIDRKTLTVTVQGGSTAKRTSLLEKIDKIITAEPADDAAQEARSESESGKENEQETKPAKKSEQPKTAIQKTHGSTASKPKPAASAPMADSDFPTLLSNDGSVAKASKIQGDTRWMAVDSRSSSVDYSQPVLSATEGKALSEASYVGDIIEEPSEIAAVLGQMK
jgi:transcription antitermination factor NusA-like protein